jgi:tetratricopeptide (TPR) repeat protein
LKNPEDKMLTQMFAAVFTQQAKAHFLRVVNRNEPLIRIDYPDSGHEYAILHTKRSANHNINIVDMFLMSSGKDMSAALGATSQLILRPSNSLLKRLFGKVDLDSKVLASLQEAARLRNAGKFKEAYDLVESFPDEVKNTRVMIDLAILLSQSVNDDEYRKQLSRLEKYFGNDDSTLFLLIDHHFFNKEYAKVHASIDRLIEKLGADGALYNLKANAYYVSNDFANAKKFTMKAIQTEPDFEAAYWTRATVLTVNEDYAELIKLFEQIEKKFGYSITAQNFNGQKFYNKFVQSPEYRAKYQH